MCGAHAAVTSGEADECVGISGVLDQLVGHVCAHWVEGGRGWASWAAKPSSRGGLRGLPLFFFFYFVVLLLCFEFKFVLDSNSNLVEFLLYKNENSFLFKHLFFGLSNNYFMVYFFKGVVRHYIK